MVQQEGGSARRELLQVRSKKNAKPEVMMVELVPDSTVDFRAYKLDRMKKSIRFRFPGMCVRLTCREPLVQRETGVPYLQPVRLPTVGTSFTGSQLTAPDCGQGVTHTKTGKVCKEVPGSLQLLSNPQVPKSWVHKQKSADTSMHL